MKKRKETTYHRLATDSQPESQKTIRTGDSQTERVMTHLTFTIDPPAVSFLVLAMASNRQTRAPAALSVAVAYSRRPLVAKLRLVSRQAEPWKG